MSDRNDGEGRIGTGIWKEQETRLSHPDMEDIRRRTALWQQRQRQKRRVRLAAAAAGLLSWAAMILIGEHPLRVGLYAAAIGSYFVLLTLLPERQTASFLSRGFVGLGLTSEPAPCLDFYRRQLEARLEVAQSGALWMAFGGLGGLALFVLSLADGETRSTAPLHLALAAGSAVLYLRARREGPEIRKEIEELRGLAG